MKRFVRMFLVITVVLIVGISACAPKADATVTAPVIVTEEAATKVTEMTQEATASPEIQATEVAPTETAAIDVEALILEKLNNKHSIARVFAAQKTREEWNITLDRMIGYGAKISEEEKQIIIDFLLSR